MEPPANAPVRFSVATWNVLAQSYAFSHHGVSPEALSWPARSERVLASLAAVGRPDVLCLQELDEFAARYQEPLEQMGYACAYTPRSGSEQGPHSDDWAPADWAAACSTSSKRHKHDGVLIAWQRERFELVDAEAVHRVDFDDLALAEVELYDGSNASSSVPPPQPDTRLMRHNAGMFVFLQPKADSSQRQGNQPLLVACTHLYWSPLHEDVKQQQLQYLLVRMRLECTRRLGSKHLEGDVERLSDQLGATSLHDTPSPSSVDPLSSFPLLLCGDFNSTPLSGVYKMLTQNSGGEKPASSSSSTNGQQEALEGKMDSASAAASAADTGTSSSDDPISPSSSASDSLPRFLCDTDLTKIAKFLRSIGIDCALFTEKERLASGGVARSHERFFARAISEKRVILTRSLKLTERRGCPPFYLLRPQIDLEAAFALVVQHFGLQFREDLFYSRCIFCNSRFREYHAAYFLGGTDPHGVEHLAHDPPPDLPRGFVLRGYRDEQNNVLTFQRCEESDEYSPCGKLFWWGQRSSEAVRTFQARLNAIVQKQHDEGQEEDSACKEAAAKTAAGLQGTQATKEEEQVPKRQLSSTRLAQLRLAARIAAPDRLVDAASASTGVTDSTPSWLGHGLSLRSAYHLREGRDPPFTNVTATFADCLDYIFVREGNGPSAAVAATAAAAVAGDVAATKAYLHVESVRPVTEGSGLDVGQLRRDTCSSGGGNGSASLSSVVSPPPNKKSKSKSKSSSAGLAPSSAAPRDVTSARGFADAAWCPQVPPGHTNYTWGLLGQPEEARVDAGHGSSIAETKGDKGNGRGGSDVADAMPAASRDASVTVLPPPQPLSTVLPNLTWPSDHLMLLAHCVWTA